jgi:hypothetical protein
VGARAADVVRLVGALHDETFCRSPGRRVDSPTGVARLGGG